MKRMIRQLLGREGADRRRDRLEMDNLYYSAIYSVLQNTTFQILQAVALKKLKAKIIKFNSKHHLGMFIDPPQPTENPETASATYGPPGV